MRNHTTKRTHQHTKKGYQIPRAYLFGITLALAIAGIWLASGTAGQSFNSVEVKFADTAPSGLQILPASCDSPPPTAPGIAGNQYAYQVGNGQHGMIAYGGQVNFCVLNSGGPTYFVPDNSPTEAQDFYNAGANSTLPGITVSPN